MTGFVVDTSVIISWCLKDEQDDYSDAVLEMVSKGEAVVPSLTPFEIANVLLVAERRERLNEADTNRCISLLDSLPILVDQEPSNLALGRILSIGRQHGLSAYDAAYLELAMREGLRLATRDKALREAARNCGVNVI